MIINDQSVTITVVTVIFFDITLPSIIYINTYISISYILYRGGIVTHFLIVTTVTVTTHPVRA